MKNDFATQAEDFMRTAGDGRVPEQMQHFAEDSVAKSREAYAKMTVAAQDATKALAEVSTAATQSAKTLGDKVLANVTANTNAAFDAAEAIARARSVPEAFKLQTAFMQTQMAKSAEQTREFFELSTKLAQQTFASFNTVASKAMTAGKSGL
jgi:phasin